MKTLQETKPKIKVQELESLADLQLLIRRDIIKVVDERDRKNLAVFLRYQAPFLEFVCQDLDSREHMNYFAISCKEVRVKNNSLKYDSQNLTFNMQIHKQALGANIIYNQLKKAGLSD